MSLCCTPGFGKTIAWLTVGASPFSLQQHPFSMSTLATRPDRLEFFAQQSGDFKKFLSRVEAGSRTWLEGTYGVFTMNPGAGRRTVFIAGGVSMRRLHSERFDLV